MTYMTVEELRKGFHLCYIRMHKSVRTSKHQIGDDLGGEGSLCGLETGTHMSAPRRSTSKAQQLGVSVSLCVCVCVCVCKPTPGINHIHLISLAPPSPPLLPFLPYLWFYSWSVARPNLEHSTSLSGPGERVRIDHMVTGQREEEEERPHGPAPLTSPFLQGHVAWTIQGGGNTVVYRTKLYPVCGISSRHVPSYLWVHGLATSTVRKIIARLDLPSFAQLYVIQP